MPSEQSLDGVVLTAILAFVILLIGVSVASGTIADADTGAERVFTQTAVVTEETGVWYELGNQAGENETVVTSRGYAVNLTGAPDSHVQSTADVPVGSGGNWTVSVWAWADSDASATNRTVLSVNGRVVITYNETASEWRAWHFDDGSTNSHVVSVAAPNQPGTWANLMVRRSGDDLTIYRNNTAGGTATISSSNIAPAPVNASTWDGRLEELRLFNESLDSGERQAVVDDPVAPRPGYARTARAMFDEPYASEQLLLFTDAAMSQSNVTFSAGFPGRELTAGRAGLGQGDYAWDTTGPQLQLLDDGSAADAPVVYVDYTHWEFGALHGFTAAFSQSVILAGLLPVLVIVGYIVYTLNGTRR